MKTVNIGTAHKPSVWFDHFEAIADAAMRAMFWVDGRIEPTDSAAVNGNDVTATRKFKAQLRKELRDAGFNVLPKSQKWL